MLPLTGRQDSLLFSQIISSSVVCLFQRNRREEKREIGIESKISESVIVIGAVMEAVGVVDEWLYTV
ncbi:unnamed protein product [Onchocerca flexuosa]|uniref:Ovule protein n=1 Tax=Onchocerca flexuosa TaxID=387005 RepID=A0A183HJ08_9BILA|nr:unnamed protein product [Onchocerca flexuosa]